MDSVNDNNKTVSIVCPHCSATAIDIISDELGRCKYCGATIVLPKNTKKDNTSGGNLFGMVEDAIEDLGDILHNVTKSAINFTNDSTTDIRHSIKARKAVILIIAVVAIAIITMAVAIPLSMHISKECVQCGSKNLSSDGEYVYCDNCGGLAVIPDVVHCPDCNSTLITLHAENATLTCKFCNFGGRLNGESWGCLHEYSGACDEDCNLCDELRFATELHTYSNMCDDTCNICGHVSFRFSHSDVNGDGYCEWCGEAM